MFIYILLSGHTEIRTDDLTPFNINKPIDGVTATIHDTKTLEVGPYTAPLKEGCTQSMYFYKYNIGPLWLDTQYQLSSK